MKRIIRETVEMEKLIALEEKAHGDYREVLEELGYKTSPNDECEYVLHFNYNGGVFEASINLYEFHHTVSVNGGIALIESFTPESDIFHDYSVELRNNKLIFEIPPNQLKIHSIEGSRLIASLKEGLEYLKEYIEKDVEHYHSFIKYMEYDFDCINTNDGARLRNDSDVVAWIKKGGNVQNDITNASFIRKGVFGMPRQNEEVEFITDDNGDKYLEMTVKGNKVRFYVVSNGNVVLKQSIKSVGIQGDEQLAYLYR